MQKKLKNLIPKTNRDRTIYVTLLTVCVILLAMVLRGNFSHPYYSTFVLSVLGLIYYFSIIQKFTIKHLVIVLNEKNPVPLLRFVVGYLAAVSLLGFYVLIRVTTRFFIIIATNIFTGEQFSGSIWDSARLVILLLVFAVSVASWVSEFLIKTSKVKKDLEIDN